MGYLIPLNRSLAGGDLWMAGVDFVTMPELPMRPTERPPLSRGLEAVNRIVSHEIMNPGLGASRPRRWRAFDEEAIIAEVVTRYHDYPYGNIDQIDARNCA